MATATCTARARALAGLLVVAGLASCVSALRDVFLNLPPVARAGGSVTLYCLYDLEGAKLYSVKWYRGNFEFYRATPHEQPREKAFPYPDIHVDLSQSDEHKVTLRRVPLHLSGTFACEVSTDAPHFSTYVKKGQLSVVDTVRRPVLTVSQHVYRPGQELEATCTLPSPVSAEPQPQPQGVPQGLDRGAARHQHSQSLLPQAPPLQPYQLTAEQRRYLLKDEASPPASFGFWINSKPVPPGLVRIDQGLGSSSSSASLRRPLSEDDFSPDGELRLKCVVTLADQYREPSHVVIVRRQDVEDEDEDEEEDEEAVEEPPMVVAEEKPTLNAVDNKLPEPSDRSAGAGAGAGVCGSIHPGVAVLLLAVVLSLR